MASPADQFILIPGRTTKQGQQINIGKDNPEYTTLVETLTMNAADMKRLGIAEGSAVRVRSPHGEAVFRCRAGSIPEGLVFVPYGPPTGRLTGGATEGTGMPLSKGMGVEIEPLEAGSKGVVEESA